MKHTKRFMVIFNKWTDVKTHEDRTEFDTIEEAREEANLIEEMYADTPRPQLRSPRSTYGRGRRPTMLMMRDVIWSRIDIGEAFWGYAILDFEEEKIIKFGHDGLRNWNEYKDPLTMKDYFFRGENEIPYGYKWDEGEYNGWLRFRWGDGKNAIGYQPTKEDIKQEKCANNPSKCKRKRFVVKEYDETEETKLDELNQELMKEKEVEKALVS